MAVAFGTVVNVTPGTGANTGASPSITTPAANPVVLVYIGSRSSSITVDSLTITGFGGTASQVATVTDGTTNVRGSIWKIVAPTANTAGTVQANFSSSVAFQMAVCTYSGADQTNPVPNADAVALASSSTPRTVTPTNLTANDATGSTSVAAAGNINAVTPNGRFINVTTVVNMAVGDNTGVTGTGHSIDAGTYLTLGARIVAVGGAASKVIFITATGAGTFTIPADWTSTNKIEVLGAGAGGKTAAGAAAGGGGGGQYRTFSNVAGLSGSIDLAVGAGGGAGVNGGNTWWGSTTFAGATLSAQGGQTTASGTAGVGGSTGAGGTGANGGPAGAGGTALTGGAGGGAAGPGGVGGTGGRGDNTSAGADFGGSGGAGAGLSTIGGNGGVGSTSAGSVGTNATGGGSGGAGGSGAGETPAAGTGVWTSTHLPDTTTTSVVTKSPGGGGGGGGSASGAAGSATNSHGGGGGGAGNGTGGTGGNGLIVITYTPSVVATPVFNSPQDIPERPRYSSSLCNWLVGATIALAAGSMPCGELATANPLRAAFKDNANYAPYNAALLTPTAPATVYLPCVVTAWAPPDGWPHTNRNWIGRPPPATVVAKPFTQVDQSNPRGPFQPNRDWTSTISRSLFAKPAFTQVDQSNPRGPFQPNRDWTSTISRSLFAKPPPSQVDQSNPRVPVQPNRDWTATIARSLFAKPPPSNYDWPLPRQPQSGQSYTQNLSLALSAKPPPASHGWQLPRVAQPGQASWAGQAPPVAVAIKPPAASCWALPVRLAPANTSWVQTPQQVAAAEVINYAPCVTTDWSVSDGPFQPNRDWIGRTPPTVADVVTTYLPCIVTGWSVSDGPFQPRRDWFNTGVPSALYTFRDPFLATRLTLQYDRRIHSYSQPNQLLTVLSAVAPDTTHLPCTVISSWVADAPVAGRSWTQSNAALLTTPAAPRPPTRYDYSLPRQVTATNRDWSQANETLLHTTPAARPPTSSFIWPLPTRLVPPDSVLSWTRKPFRPVPTVTPPRQPDGDPDYWNLPWFQVEGGTFADNLRAKTLIALDEVVSGTKDVKTAVPVAAKAVREYAKASGLLLSDTELAELERLAQQLYRNADQKRADLALQTARDTRALLIALMLQQDEEEALIALGII